MTFLDVMCRSRGDLYVMVVHGISGGPEMSMMERQIEGWHLLGVSRSIGLEACEVTCARAE
jgi:hypothetical protein